MSLAIYTHAFKKRDQESAKFMEGLYPRKEKEKILKIRNELYIGYGLCEPMCHAAMIVELNLDILAFALAACLT